MKSWTVSDELKADAALAARVEALRPALTRVAGPRVAPEIEARWDVAPGGVSLWLADDAWPEGVQTSIPATELTPGPDADSRLRWAVIQMHQPGTRAMMDRILLEVGVE